MDELGFRAGRAVVVGDKISDLQLGQALSMPTILLKTGYGLLTLRESGSAEADYVAEGLEDAADRILDLEPRKILEAD
jgi:phosphoglycolate phosphatase-like HAD superfamily hydrolase